MAPERDSEGNCGRDPTHGASFCCCQQSEAGLLTDCHIPNHKHVAFEVPAHHEVTRPGAAPHTTPRREVERPRGCQGLISASGQSDGGMSWRGALPQSASN
jgi:hypothetical protein